MSFELENNVPMPTNLEQPPQAPAQTEHKPKAEVKATFDSTTACGVVLDNWRNAKVTYDQAKNALSEAKNSVLQYVGDQVDIGTSRFATNHFILKTTKTEKIEVNAPDLNRLNVALTEIATMCGADVASQVISWKPTLNKKVFDSMPLQAQEKLNEFLTLSYSTPTLSIEELK